QWRLAAELGRGRVTIGHVTDPDVPLRALLGLRKQGGDVLQDPGPLQIERLGRFRGRGRGSVIVEFAERLDVLRAPFWNCNPGRLRARLRAPVRYLHTGRGGLDVPRPLPDLDNFASL